MIIFITSKVIRLLTIFMLLLWQPIQNRAYINSFVWFLHGLLVGMQISNVFAARKFSFLSLRIQFAAKHWHILENFRLILSRQFMPEDHDLCATKSVSQLVRTMSTFWEIPIYHPSLWRREIGQIVSCQTQL